MTKNKSEMTPPSAPFRELPEHLACNKQVTALSLSVLMPVYNERYLVMESLRRVLALDSEYLASLEVIIVDDRSTDGSWEILEQSCREFPNVKLFRHEKNQGKGAAIRTALKHASGDVTIVHDADLEYHPEDIPGMLKIFLEEGADAVFGSRYLSAQYRRVLLYKHSLINKFITAAINFLTDLDLTDVETCYKALKTDLFQSIPIRSNDFRFEVEITMKLARRRVNIFEVPVRYLPRSYEEGKKIRMKDGFLALWAALRFFLIEDIFHRGHHGLHTLLDMNNARRFNKWIADTLRPYIQSRVLEIGAGVANLTRHFIPRELYAASDIDRHAVAFLSSFAIGKPYLKVFKLDAGRTGDFAGLKHCFDTVLAVNVLEHVKDEAASLRNFYDVLVPGGKLVALVPQHPFLYGSFDAVLEHRERYTRAKLQSRLAAAGFEIEVMNDFNRTTVPSWFLNGRILRRKRFSLVQLKILEIFMPLIRRIDPFWPWGGLSLIVVAVKKK